MSAIARPRSAAIAIACALALGTLGAGRAHAQPGFPNIPVWSYAGAWRTGADSVVSQPRTISVRWLRDPAAEARPDFAGYRIYRATTIGDTTRMVLLRRFSRQTGDSIFSWHFPNINGTTPLTQRVATFVDPDSAGRFVKVCRRRSPQEDPLGVCLSRGDSVYALVPPPGPHDGFRTWYAITYEARNTTGNDYVDLFAPGPIGDPMSYGMGAGTVGVVLADLNGDAIQDIATVNQSAGTVSVRLGKGDGTFGPQAEYFAGAGPRAIAVGDMNHDGHPDLVTVGVTSQAVSVLLGHGDGGFALPAGYLLGGAPASLAIDDVNNDGRLDVVVANAYAPSVSILLGVGDGTLGAASVLASAVQPAALSLGDLNGDRRPDLSIASAADGAVAWRLNNGDGTFGTEFTRATGAGARAVLIADLNGDSKTDLAVAVGGTDQVAVLPGNGDGTFGPTASYAAGAGPAALVVAEINGDTSPDLMVTDGVGGTVTALYNIAFDFSSHTTVPAGIRPIALAVADIDHEGLADFAIADSSGSTSNVVFGPSNQNHKAANVANDVWEPRASSAFPDSHFFAHAIEPTAGPTANLAKVGVVPNPYRATEAWNPTGENEMHFINLPVQARIRIYTLAGDLVRELHHEDSVRDFERWDLKNGAGRDVSSGIYMFRVEAANFFHQSRFVIIR